jgi:hypothetical protein
MEYLVLFLLGVSVGIGLTALVYTLVVLARESELSA